MKAGQHDVPNAAAERSRHCTFHVSEKERTRGDRIVREVARQRGVVGADLGRLDIGVRVDHTQRRGMRAGLTSAAST